MIQERKLSQLEEKFTVDVKMLVVAASFNNGCLWPTSDSG